jgi:hypothetical protein
MSSTKIAVIQRGKHAPIVALLDVLKRMYPVEWTLCRELPPPDSADAVIALDADAKQLRELVVREKSALVFSDRALWNQTRQIGRVEVAPGPEAPLGLSGAWLPGLEKTRVGNWGQEICAQVVARDDSGPVWLRRRQGGARIDVANVGFDDTVAYGVFTPAMWHEQVLQLIILIDFVREVAGDSQWTHPGPSASIIFDDPNLHRMRYGFLDYAQTLESMRRHNYHVAVATIPLDTWYVSNRVAAFFREHSREYSFVYHGNNHVSHELARSWTQTQRSGLVTQALQRMARFQASARIEVERIMVAPHGACSGAMLGELAAQDFQGACISWGSLNYHNSGQTWAGQLGLKHTEIIHELPVITRTSFEGADEKNLRLAMFLHQPIILRGHHEDLRNGLGGLEEKVHLVNELAHPRWDSIGHILQSNYRTRVRNGHLEVRPYARCVEVEVPSDCSAVVVEGAENGWSPWDDASGEWVCRKVQSNGQETGVQGGDGEGTGPCRMRIRRKNRLEQQPDGYLRQWSALWPVTRRFLTEMRDRMAPYVAGKKVRDTAKGL